MTADGAGAAAAAPSPLVRRMAALRTAVDVVGGLVLYYVLRLAGMSVFAAVLAGAALSAALAVWSIVRTRRADGIAVYTTGLVILGLGISLIAGSPRFLLSKEGWSIAAAGICFLLSLRAQRPLAFHFTRLVLEGRFGVRGQTWEALWAREPQFRRIWRVSTVFWGVGLIVDGGIRVLLAYTLPIDLVPALGMAQYVVFVVLMQPITGVYYFYAGLWPMLRAERAALRGAGPDASRAAADELPSDSATKTFRSRHRQAAGSDR